MNLILNGRLDKLCEIALKNDRNYNHLSVVMTTKNSILTIGINNFKTHPINKLNNYRTDFVHAEIDAIVKVDKSIFYNQTPIVLFSLRFSKGGRLLNAKPCRTCQLILERYTNLRNIYYSTDKGEIVEL